MTSITRLSQWARRPLVDLHEDETTEPPQFVNSAATEELRKAGLVVDRKTGLFSRRPGFAVNARAAAEQVVAERAALLAGTTHEQRVDDARRAALAWNESGGPSHTEKFADATSAIIDEVILSTRDCRNAFDFLYENQLIGASQRFQGHYLFAVVTERGRDALRVPTATHLADWSRGVPISTVVIGDGAQIASVQSAGSNSVQVAQSGSGNTLSVEQHRDALAVLSEILSALPRDSPAAGEALELLTELSRQPVVGPQWRPRLTQILADAASAGASSLVLEGIQRLAQLLGAAL